MTLTDTIEYINIALNYPALNYNDLKLFLDMAIAELNTTLHTNIPNVSKMIRIYQKRNAPGIGKDVIQLDTDPQASGYNIPTSETRDPTLNYEYYYCVEDGVFYLDDVAHTRLKGMYVDTSGRIDVYEAAYYGSNICLWVKADVDNAIQCEISDYLPDDWIMLWLVPYVCYKYTVRDGGTAQTFAEEIMQGFQQLQETYDIPDEVFLATYADKPAYTELVQEYLPNLNVKVKTLAIYESMKHARAVSPIYPGFYDRGGF